VRPLGQKEFTPDGRVISMPAPHCAVGFDDRGILQITPIASWFNYINRVADALGWGGSETPCSTASSCN
jgi:hypothetical protein